MKTMILAILSLVVTWVSAADREPLVGTISRFECGDNCYLQITLDAGSAITHICNEPELCRRWSTRWEPEVLGKRVRCAVGMGVAYSPNVILGDDGEVLGTEELGTVEMFTTVDIIE